MLGESRLLTFFSSNFFAVGFTAKFCGHLSSRLAKVDRLYRYTEPSSYINCISNFVAAMSSTPRANPTASSGNAPPRSTPRESTENDVHNTALRPELAALQPASKKKRNHRGGRKKRPRKQSFAASTEDGSGMPGRSNRGEPSQSAARDALYRLQGRNLSSTSLESEALLDHRLDLSLEEW